LNQSNKEKKLFKEKILVVDDDADLLKTLSEMIESFGYTNIINASDGEEAISQYRKHRPDLVLMDIVMPKMDGIAAFFKIREFDPSSKVIFITAYDPPTKYREAKGKCAIYLVRKPFAAPFLNELINRHILEKTPCP